MGMELGYNGFVRNLTPAGGASKMAKSSFMETRHRDLATKYGLQPAKIGIYWVLICSNLLMNGGWVFVDCRSELGASSTALCIRNCELSHVSPESINHPVWM